MRLTFGVDRCDYEGTSTRGGHHTSTHRWHEERSEKGVPGYCYNDYNLSIQLMICHRQGHRARKCIWYASRCDNRAPLCRGWTRRRQQTAQIYHCEEKKKEVLKLEQPLLHSKSTGAHSNLNYLDSTAVYPGLLVFAFSYFRIKRNNGTFKRAE